MVARLKTDNNTKYRQNLDIERDYLASVLLSGKTYNVPKQAFTEPVFRDVYDVCSDIEFLDGKVDPISVTIEARKRGLDITKYDISVLVEDVLPFVTGHVPEEVSRRYATEMLEYYQSRIYAKNLIESLTDKSGEEISSKIAGLQERLDKIKQISSHGEAERITDAARSTMEMLEQDRATGPSTGFQRLNRIMGGWLPDSLTVVCGRPSMGKTAFMLSSIFLTRHNLRHLVFSLEMPKEQLIIRLVSMLTGLSYLDIVKVNKTPERWPEIADALNEIAEYQTCIVDDGRIKLPDIEQHIQKFSPDVVWLDYLQLLDNAMLDSYTNREREIAAYAGYLKTIAKKTHVPMIALAQLNRQVTKENRKPVISDLRESGAIEQIADVVLAVHVGKDTPQHERELLILKGRNLALAEIQMGWAGKKTMFYELADEKI